MYHNCFSNTLLMSGNNIVIICKVMQTNIKQRVYLQQCLLHCVCFSNTPFYRTTRRKLCTTVTTITTNAPGARFTPNQGRGTNSCIGGCLCWYWNSAYYAVWTSYGCKSKGSHGCGAAVYNFGMMRWCWCRMLRK